ncbi:unnamed protein product [Oikopleura dioica]|uniref:Uncharacterized protein n=1 Tax=Oikopleura dioica TaxID=34765 RepID=E4WQK9_OIKDI|nr:unnamed protein product [Oikopleura dioica]
MQSHNTQNQKN